MLSVRFTPFRVEISRPLLIKNYLEFNANVEYGRIITSIASHIDLNTLDALSLTCRQIRANLLQFRSQLLTSTLHCENEDVELDPEHTFRYRARAADWYFIESGREAPGPSFGKVGDCARDMVGGCRRCARVVCRVSSRTTFDTSPSRNC